MAVDPNVDPFQSLGGGIRLASGDWVMKGMKGSEGPQWGSQPGQTPAPTTPAPAVPGQPQTAQQAVTQQATVGQTPQAGQQTNVAGAFQQALVNKLAPQPVTPQSASVAPALAANRLSEQRAQERNQRQLATMASAQGFDNSGAFDAQRIGLGQDRAAREGAFAGQTILDQSRLDQQQQLAAMGLGGQMLTDQDRMALQRYGIDLDAALRREGLGAQTALGQGDLDLRRMLGLENIELGRQQIGANLGMFGANLSQQALLSLLGSL